MSGIDERVVEMKFNNGQFQNGIKTTMDSIANLTKSLQFKGATDGLDNVANNVGFLGGKFSALSVTAIAALGTIVNAATNAGLSIMKSLTIQPITDGFKEYELKMGSIQTILANTTKEGTNLGQVNTALDELNKYSDATIYNFGQMTKNVGLFTNAGLGLQASVDMIKGFSNTAAASGTSAEGAANAAYQLSQALSSGTVRLMDWRSLTNVGMGNKNMQDGLIQIAGAMGMFTKDTTTAEAAAADFNSSLESKWLSADVMANYLKIQAGTMDSAAMAGLGLSSAQIDEFVKLQKVAYEAATKVRTATQLYGVLQEAVGSTWAESSQIILGDFNQATDLFTGINDRLGPLIGAIGKARNDALRSWADLGGRDDMQKGFLNIIDAMQSVITPISNAWAKIFPTEKQGQLLANISKGFEKFTNALILTEGKMANLQLTFQGIFAIFHMVFTILSVVGQLIMAVINPLIKGFDLTGGGILALMGKVASWVVSLDNMLQKSKFVTSSVATVTAAMASATGFIERMAAVIKSLFGGAFDAVFGKTTNAADAMQAKIDAMSVGPLKDAQQALLDAKVASGEFESTFTRSMKNAGENLKTFGAYVKEKSLETLTKGFDGLKGIGGVLSTAFSAVMTFFTNLRNNTVSIGTTVGNAVTSIWKAIQDAMAGIDPNIVAGSINLGLFAAGAAIIKQLLNAFGFQGFEKMLNGVTSSLQSFSAKLKAEAIIKIAGAIGILALSMWLVAQIPSDRLLSSAVAMVAMGVLLMQLMKTMSAVSSDKGFIKMPVISTALAILGGAMLLLAMAASEFSKMSIAEVGKALLGLSGALIASNFARGGKVDAVALFALALAFNTLAKGIVLLAGVAWGDLAKAGLVMGALLGAMKLLEMMKLDGKNLIAASVSMTILGVAMMVLAGAIKVMALLDWTTFLTGMGRMAIALVVIAETMARMPNDMVKNAAAILILAYALGLLAGVILAFGSIDTKTLAIGLGTVAVILGIIAGALALFKDDAILGAAAILLVAYALGILTPVIILLGNTPWQVLALGLGAIAAVFVLLGIAAYVLAPAVPVLIGLGIAIGLLGLAAIMTGQGLFMMATGLGVLAALGAPGAIAIAAVIVTLAKVIPQLVEQVVAGIKTFITSLKTAAPEIFSSIASILISLLDSLKVVVPPLITFIIDTIKQLVTEILQYLYDTTPKFTEQAMYIMTAFLQGVADNVQALIDAASDLIVNFLLGLAANLPDIQAAGKTLIVTYINGLADNLPDIIAAGTNLIITFIEGIGKAALDITTAAGETLITFMNGIEAWIRDNSQRINDAGWGIATAIIDGMKNGLLGGVGRVTSAVKGIADSAISSMKGFLGIHSPSKVFQQLGEYTKEGFIKGLKSGSKDEISQAFDDMRGMIEDLFSTATDEIDKQTKALNDLNAAQDKDAKAIGETTAALAEATSERDRALAGLDAMDKGLTRERDQLSGLATEYASVTQKLTDAQQALADAQTARSDYSASTKDNYDNYASVDSETKLEDFLTKMRLQLTQTADLKAGLAQLSTLGINDKLYQQLVEQGADALPFISQVLDGGQGSVDELNRLNDELNSVASGLGKDASSELYTAGVNTAQALVDGLASQQSALVAQMNALADAMVSAIKSQLGIQTTMQATVGTGSGASRGLATTENALNAVASSANGATGAVTAMDKALTLMSNITPDNLNIEPTITPVLDLSKVQDQASSLDTMIGSKTITVDTSAASASSVAAAVKANQDATAQTNANTGVRDVTFVQNNTSPEKLSEVEIYRQTKNQLSVMKGGLTT